MSDTRPSFEQLAEPARLALARGDKDGARRSLSAALQSADADGSTNTESADSLVRLGILYQDAGLTTEAERLFGDAVAVAEATLGPDHPQLATALSCLGTALVARGATDAAEPLLVRALEISERELGADHPDLNGLLNALSRLYLKQSAFSRAEPLLERLLALKRLKGDEHPEVATVLASLALVRQGVGDHEGAEQLGRRVLQIREKTLAPNHFAIASALELLGEACAARGKAGEAGRLFQRALSIREQTLGVGHASLRVSRERIVDLQMQAAEMMEDDEAAPMPLPIPQLPIPAAKPAVRPLPPVAMPSATRAPAPIFAEPVRVPAVIDIAEKDEPRQQALVLPAPTGALSLQEELQSIANEMSEGAAASGYGSPIQRLVSSISAAISTRRGQATVGGAAALVVLASIVGLQSRSIASAMNAPQQPLADRSGASPVAGVAAAAPANNDSSSRIVRTAAGSVAFHPATSSASQSPSRANDSRAESSTRKASDDTPSLDIARNVKIAAPTIALGRADSIARASEAPSKLVEGSFSRQFWTAGIDKKAGTDAGNGPTPAKLIGDMPHPVYPEFLRKNSVEGEVVVRFVIDVTGHPDMGTIEVIRTPHEAMTAAVRRVVQQMRFEPARTGGPDSPARTELVQISFVFQADPK